ncbi:MAG: malto-oligosyltrehalose synthase, partial [Bacillota bacterium]
MTPADGALARLAAACGIEGGYRDALGQWREPGVETQRAILEAMGVDAAHPAEALAEREAARAREASPKVIVQRLGAAPFAELPIGYHAVETSAANGGAATTVIVAPASCHLPDGLERGERWWGCTLQLYGLRSKRNAGIGDFTDLARAVDGCARRGAAFVGMNPLHALALQDAAHASPYRPSSRLFTHALYLDVEAIAEFREVAAKDPALAASWHAECEALRDAELVDHPGVARAKRRMFDALFAQFREAHLVRQSARARAFEHFRAAQGERLRLHAIHEALRDHHAGPWPTWPEPYRDVRSPEVRRFAEEHADEVALHEYLQWQAELQLEAVERRCHALGMPIGLYADLAVSIAPDGSEAWSHPGVYARGVSVGAPPDPFSRRGQSWGLPPMLPAALERSAYAPFIATLRAAMRHAGALRIDHVMALERLFWVPDGMEPSKGAYVRYPLRDLLGIVALESHLGRTVVIGEDLGTVSAEVRAALRESGVLSYRLLVFERDYEKKNAPFHAPADFPARALAAWSTHDLPTFVGWWQERDIEARVAAGHLDGDEARHERADRASSRVALLEALDRERLKPRGAWPSDAATATLDLAVHDYIARAPSMLMAVQLEDIFGVREQANLPGTIDEHPNWKRKLTVPVEAWGRDPRFKRFAGRLGAMRGKRAPRSRSGPEIPRATYRLQLHAGFTFRDATALVPYLAELGVSHLYCSPLLAARPGSLHGYDVVDHSRLNPEFGAREDFDRLVAALHANGMKLMADIVPNHMVVLAARNRWWEDVLRHGQGAKHAGYFDIDWQPPTEHLSDRVLLPILAGRYGDELDAGRIRVARDSETSELVVRYFEHTLPLRAPSHCRVEDLNGTPGNSASFDRLHALLEAQSYRLAYWRVAHDEINYRRFFDVNELAALKQEHPGVFEDTHRLIVSLVHEGAIDALRIDHPDGLFDPKAYFGQLQAACGKPVYVAVEKILAPFEDLPADWEVHGTTGYRFLNLASALCVDPSAEGRMTRIYQAFTGTRTAYRRIARQSRRLVATSSLASEVTVAANRLARIAQGDRRTRDFTLAALREGLADVLASFPVYRTYIDAEVRETDRATVDRAVAEARAARRASDPAIFSFIRDALTCELPAATPAMAAEIRHFARKFQQVSSPVAAKGIEDTAFYRYNRLAALNEVGGDPDVFGMTTARFMRAIRRHARRFPHTMLATSTHDNKRSEDVRARIAALSEMPAAWRLRLRRWQRMNASKVADLDGTRAPSPEEEYLLYQTIVGTFPAEGARDGLAAYRERIVEF